MKDIIEVITNMKDMRHLVPASALAVAVAETKLNLSFSEEYKKYVRTFGAMSACGVELTGVTSSPRLDVVAVTMRYRETYDNMPADKYVIEETQCEGLIVLQDHSGAVWFLAPVGEPEIIFDTLADYLSSIQK